MQMHREKAMERILTRNQTLLTSWDWTSSFQIVRKYISVVEAPSLWCFVMAALAG